VATAEIWAAVFSRETVKFILNTSDAKNLTCFHGLYSRDSAAHLAPLLVLFLNSSWGRIAFSQVNRFYGDGLNKLEPKDVEAMPCPTMPTQSASQAAMITAELIKLEPLPETARRHALDRMVASLLDLPLPTTSGAVIPGESRSHPKKTSRLSAPRKRRVAQGL
jgi:adenine-specific DNA-methyltransferase